VPKILIVVNSLTGGGAERAMNLLANELVSAGCETTLLAINASPNDLVENKCEVIKLNRNKQSGISEIVRTFMSFRREIKRISPGFVILNCDLPEFLAAFSITSKARLICVEHGTPWGNRPKLGLLVRSMLKIRKCFWVSVSPHVKIWPENLNADAMIPNLIYPFKQTTEDPFSQKSLGRLLYVGRLERTDKRAHWVLELARELDVEAEFVGEGSQSNFFREEASKTRKRILISGYSKDPWTKYRSGDLVVVPSSREGDGLVALEAISLSLPVLMSDIPAFRRFRLPEENYCSSLHEFEKRIRAYSDNITALIPNEEISKLTLQSRSKDEILQAWVNLLGELLI